MPNLYGSTPEQDCEDFDRLFEDPGRAPGRTEGLPLLPDRKRGVDVLLSLRRMASVHPQRVARRARPQPGRHSPVLPVDAGDSRHSRHRDRDRQPDHEPASGRRTGGRTPRRRLQKTSAPGRSGAGASMPRLSGCVVPTTRPRQGVRRSWSSWLRTVRSPASCGCACLLRRRQGKGPIEELAGAAMIREVPRLWGGRRSGRARQGPVAAHRSRPPPDRRGARGRGRRRVRAGAGHLLGRHPRVLPAARFRRRRCCTSTGRRRRRSWRPRRERPDHRPLPVDDGSGVLAARSPPGPGQLLHVHAADTVRRRLRHRGGPRADRVLPAGTSLRA